MMMMEVKSTQVSLSPSIQTVDNVIIGDSINYPYMTKNRLSQHNSIYSISMTMKSIISI